MDIAELLARPHLAPRLRTLVGTAVAIWRGDWPTVRTWMSAARQLGQARADLEETLLQAVLFCGFPRIVSAFEQLREVWPVATPPTGGALPLADQPAAARQLFATIYGPNTAAVEAMLVSCHGDFHAFVFESAYGRILTRPHLTARERELLAIGLLAAQDQPRQFAGHARGAQNFGATREEIAEVLLTTFGDGSQASAWQQRARGGSK